MINVLSRPFGSARGLREVLAAFLLVFSGTAYGQTSSDYAVVDGVMIYYAILPAEMLRTYPPGSEDARMHGGVPDGKHIHHLQIALFDAGTNMRIDDARVTAMVAEIGLGGTEKTLEPFQVSDALTYGGYVEFQKRELYEIRVRVVLPERGRVIEKTFEYRHQ
tara:strand:- start:9920 stop:10408 length:489 start_codon:yes stop_codon:yes gene_type:complete